MFLRAAASTLVNLVLCENTSANLHIANGFTLLELMIVIAIIAVLMSMSFT